MPKQGEYSNPMLDREQLEAAMQEDNVSVCSGQDPDAGVTDAAMKKGNKGAASSLKETVAKAAEQPVIVKKEEEDAQPFWLAPLVVFLFIFFDGAKIIGERQATHGTSINPSYMQWTICTCNLFIAFGLTAFLSGKEGVRMALSWSKLKGYILPSVFFASGQLFNLLQNNYIEGGTRKVFAQLRIPLTAAFARVMMGTAYSPLQWITIFLIVVSVVQFSMLTSKEASAFAGEDMMKGLALSVLSNLSAVLGSLGGERTMKEAKKLPFYLQKFQFEVWTLLFAIVGGFVFAPAGAFLADLVKNEGTMLPRTMEGPEFVKNWLTSYRATQWQYADALLKDVPFEPTYQVAADATSGFATPAMKEQFPNSFDVAGYTTAADESESTATYMGVSMNDAKFAGMQEAVQKIADLSMQRRSPITKNLSNYSNRIQFVDSKGYKNHGRIGQIAEHHFRKIPGNMLLDTKFYTKSPFSKKVVVMSPTGISENFVVYFGTPAKQDQKFVDAALMRRSNPGQLDATVMSMNEFDGEFYNTKFEASQTDSNSPDVVTKAAPYFDLVTKRVSLSVKTEEESKAAKATFNVEEPVLNGEHTVAFSYKKLFKYTPKDKKFVLNYIREKTEALVYLPANAASPLDTVTVTQKSVKLLQLNLTCASKAEFAVSAMNNEEIKAPRAPQECVLEAPVRKSKGVVSTTVDLRVKAAKPEAKVVQTQVAMMTALRAEKEAAKAKVSAAYEKVLKGFTTDAESGLMSAGDELDETNAQAKMELNRNDFKKLVDGKKLRVSTYPGKFSAGVSGGGFRGCDANCFKLTSADKTTDKTWESNYSDLDQFKFRFNNKPEDMEANTPSLMAQAHGFTHAPFPGMWITPILLVAMFCNGAQQWMSAYISKVLSSLWKNICAAVSLACVIWVEKLFFSSEADKDATDWYKLAFATMGVMLSVFVFQLLPKPPKEEPKKDLPK